MDTSRQKYTNALCLQLTGITKFFYIYCITSNKNHVYLNVLRQKLFYNTKLDHILFCVSEVFPDLIVLDAQIKLGVRWLITASSNLG